MAAYQCVVIMYYDYESELELEHQYCAAILYNII